MPYPCPWGTLLPGGAPTPSQDEALRADQERLDEVEAAVGQLKAHLESLVASRANRVRQQQQQLQKRLLRVMHIVEVRNPRGRTSSKAMSHAMLLSQYCFLVNIAVNLRTQFLVSARSCPL